MAGIIRDAGSKLGATPASGVVSGVRCDSAWEFFVSLFHDRLRLVFDGMRDRAEPTIDRGRW